ncbi:MAG TPA: hypothetical protein VFU21_25965 [Kofleriaceae bacterium]|nr:hypothetical protein [Kofleriaceae bacterium]
MRTLAPNVIDRLGAALVAPVAALEAAEKPTPAGRAPGDLAVLVLAGFAATHLVSITRAGWMLIDGDGTGAIDTLLSQLSDAVRAPLVFVLAAGLLLLLLAGKRRSAATDFDLACIAAVPLGLMAVLLELVDRAGVDAAGIRRAALVVGCAWGAVILAFAVRQARRREAPA